MDAGDTLAYSATLGNGNPLPSWLSFDAATRTFSGTPQNGDVGTLTVRVIATDQSNATAEGTFQLAIADLNETPIVANPILDQSATEDTAFSFQVPASTFSDPDLPDNTPSLQLTYSATLENGNPLPNWLSFDPVTRTFSGTPQNADVGTLNVRVIASDRGNLTAEDVFQIAIANTNDAPTLVNAIANQNARENTAFNFTVSGDTFDDVDVGDQAALVYTASLGNGNPLPNWLNFDANTRTFSGTPTAGDVGQIDVRVTATDPSNASVASTFQLTITDNNTPPTVANAIADQTATEDTAFSFAVPANAFNDPDVGDSLSYTASLSSGAALPSWLSFDASTRTFSGTPLNANVGVLSVRVTATDRRNAFVFDDFQLTVNNTNDAPTLDNPIPNQTVQQDRPLNFQFAASTFNDIDAGDTLNYTATLSNGDPLPAWLIFDPGTRTFTGTPGSLDVGTITVRVTATDSGSASAFSDFTLRVDNVNDAPALVTPIVNQSATEDTLFSFQFPDTTFNDPDGDPITYSATLANNQALPSWLSFNGTTRSFSGTPTNNDVGTISVKVTARDGGNLSGETTFQIAIANVNDAPTVTSPIANQSTPQNQAYSFQFAANTFTDIDVGDILTYSARLSNGAELPAWLIFSPVTRTFSGTPTNSDVGTVTVRLTASDGQATAFNDFNLTVNRVNGAPTVANPIAAQTANEDAPFSFQIPADAFIDPDSDPLTYTAALSTGAPLPSWLSFNAATRTFSGLPANSDVGSISIRVTATDGAGLFAENTFGITIANTNDAPTVRTLISNQSALQGSAFNFTIPANTFEDIDVGDRLTYTARLEDNSPLPGWLSFDASTGHFSGTPGRNDVATLRLKVIATDTGNAAAETVFQLAIAPSDTAPVLAVPLADQTINQDSPYTFTIPDTAFIDADAGDILSYQVGQTNGRPLPTWLTFDAATRTFSGTPLNADVGSLDIRVTVSDRTGKSISDDFRLIIADVNDAPTGLNLSNTSISSSLLPGDSVGVLSAIDPDQGDTFTYSLVSGVPDNATFTIVNNDLRLVAPLTDPHIKSSYNIRIRVTDRGGLFYEQDFNIGLIVGSAPTNITISNRAIAENLLANTPIATLNTVDIDPDEAFTYTLVAGPGDTDNADFEIVDNRIQIKQVPDYETKTTYSIRVRSTDRGRQFFEKSFTFNVIDVNEAPTDVRLNGNSIAENSPIGSVVGILSTVDPDLGDSFTYSLVGDDPDNAAFTIVGNQLRLAMSPDFEAKPRYNIQVRSTDRGGLLTEQTLTVDILDLVEAAAITPNSPSVPALDLNGPAAGIDFAASGLLGFSTGLVSSSATLTDSDSPNLASGLIVISNLLNGPQVEILQVDTAGTGLLAEYNREPGVLSLSGSASLATYLRVFRSVVYRNLALIPNIQPRTILFIANDGRNSSPVARTTLSFDTTLMADTTEGDDAFLFTTLRSDVISGKGGNDVVSATVAGLQQSDRIDGGAGFDTFFLLDGTTAVEVNTANINQISGIDPNTIVANFERFDFSRLQSGVRMSGGNNADHFIGGAGNDILLGGGGDDVLTGNAGNDTLQGGAGNDLMIGGSGNDIYQVTDAGDRIVEGFNGGTDTVLASINTVLANNVENLTLTGFATNGTGNNLNNLITGNRFNNMLIGGLGNDHLRGMEGNDQLLGGSGDDWLNGGMGTDMLTGGAGRDRFMISAAPGAGNDTLVDFNPADDTILFSNSGYARSIAPGAIARNRLVYGTRALTANDRFIYNRGSGTLFFDPDGSGRMGQIAIATLRRSPLITAADIIVTT